MSETTADAFPAGHRARADLVQGFARVNVLAAPAWIAVHLSLLPDRRAGTVLAVAVALSAGYAWWASRRGQVLTASLAVIMVPWIALTAAWVVSPSMSPVAWIGLALVVVLSMLLLRRPGAILGLALVGSTVLIESSHLFAPELPPVSAAPVESQPLVLASFAMVLSAVAWVTSGALTRREASARTLDERVQNLAARLKLSSADADDIRSRLDEAMDRILEKNRFATFGRLAGGVTHDFANMLSVVLANTELALESASEPTPRQALEDIRSAAERAGAMSSQILGFLRGDPTGVHEPVDLAAHSRDVGELLRKAVPHSVEIRTTGSPSAWIRGNPIQLTQLMFNLALNGAQAMPDGGVLEIEVARSGSCVRLRVRDTGVGMSEDVVAKIFQPLFSTKPAGEGSGLGMTVVDHIVGLHDARLEIASEVGLGTTMTVEFPAIQPA
jgi:signal transduction histidine kinase